MLHIAFVVFCIVILVIGFVVYGKVLMSYMQIFAQNVGKGAQTDASTGLTWFWNKLHGWKTVIMGIVSAPLAGFAAIPADALQTIISLPTEAIVADQKIAAWVTTVIVSLIPIVHAQGIARAAQTPPQQE